MAVLIIIAITAVSALGDYLLKVASGRPHSYTDWHFIAGALVFASTAFAWVRVMKTIKLTEVGAVFSLSYILMLAAIGIVFFRERLNWQEWVGIGMALGATVMLRRFS